MPAPHSLALTFALLALPVQAEVHVVDVSGQGDFLDLPEAIAAAVGGDTILVRAGTYSAFTLDGAAVDIVAQPTAAGAVVVRGGTSLRSLPAGLSIVLSGLSLESEEANEPATLSIAGCGGSVRIADCVITGVDGELAGLGSDPSRPACRVSGSSTVAFIDCDVRGGAAGGDLFCPQGTPSAGLVASASIVEVHGGRIAGGPAPDVNFPIGGDAGNAVELLASSGLRAYGATLVGGDGGDGDLTFTFCSCGEGGDGVVADATSSADVVGGSLEGGAGGGGNLNGAPGSCPDGVPSLGNVFFQPAPLRSFESARVVETGGPITGEVRGVAGESVFLVVSSVPTLQPYPALGGTLTVGWPYFLRALPAGVIPANGVLPFDENVAGFAPGFGALTITMQPIMSGPTGRWLGTPSVVAVLEPGL